MVTPQSDLEKILTPSPDIDHLFCAWCYPDLRPPASLCGMDQEEDDDLCIGECSHPECKVCREVMATHICNNHP